MASVYPETQRAEAREITELDATSDRELLIQFRTGREAAFTELVLRHGGMVFGVCQRVLRRTADAEDAFQATFLVLARKAKSIEWQESIAGWLHQTALRTSLKLRAITVRRREVESKAARDPSLVGNMPAATPDRLADLRELSEILDEELAGLPARFREVILLSQVHGLSREGIAERLGITAAAVKDRLERGREQLRSRLQRRGISLTAALLAGWLVPGTTWTSSLSTLTVSASQAAGAFATGQLAAGVSPTAATLAEGVLRFMGLEKLRSISVWLISFLTAGGIAFGMLHDEPTRFNQGLRGRIVAVTAGRTPTVTISLEDFSTLLNLDVSPRAKVWTAYESGSIDDLKEGQFASLRLADDHRTVNEIHIQGSTREAAIKSVAPSGKIVIVEEGDDEGSSQPATEVQLAPDAILRIGGLPAARGDLKPGMQAPLEFGRDGKLVNAIEMEAAANTLIEGELLRVAPTGDKLVLVREDDAEDDAPTRVEQSLTLNAETIIELNGKSARAVDLAPGSSLKLRLSDDGRSIRAIQAVSPESNDDDATP